jgi:hypothetical protein
MRWSILGVAACVFTREYLRSELGRLLQCFVVACWRPFGDLPPLVIEMHASHASFPRREEADRRGKDTDRRSASISTRRRFVPTGHFYNTKISTRTHAYLRHRFSDTSSRLVSDKTCHSHAWSRLAEAAEGLISWITCAAPFDDCCEVALQTIMDPSKQTDVATTQLPPGESPAFVIDEDEEALAARVLRKIDWRLIPLMFITYNLNFMDKTILSSASVFGLREDTVRIHAHIYTQQTNKGYRT